MTAATLLPRSNFQSAQPLQRGVSPIARVQDAVGALPAPTLPQDRLAVTTIRDVASTHVIDPHTLAVIAHKDRHIRPIAAIITEHLLGVTATIVGSAIIVTLT